MPSHCRPNRSSGVSVLQQARLTGVEPGDLANLTDARDGSENVVYVVQAQHGGPIKIGHTTWEARHRRLAGLQTGSPHPLEFRRIVNGEMWLERALHEYFAPHRMKGEWFALADIMFPFCPEAFR